MTRNISIFMMLFMLASFAVHSQSFDDLAKTPPMGWNSWNKFRCDINENLGNDWDIRDLWKHENIGKTDKNFTEIVPAHGVIMLRLSGGTKIEKV